MKIVITMMEAERTVQKIDGRCTSFFEVLATRGGKIRARPREDGKEDF